MNASQLKERGKDVSRLKERGQAVVAGARARWPIVDHFARALLHYNSVMGSQLAAAATYFAFLSFFPLVALLFAAVGYVVDYVPNAEAAVTKALASVLPGMIGSGPDQINVKGIASHKAGVGVIGLLVLLYSGLGWISALRTSLQAVFAAVAEEKRNFVLNKLFDLLVLIVVGIVLVVSVGLGTSVTGFTDTVLGLLGLSHMPGIGTVLLIAALVVGVGANTVLFFTLYRLLPRHEVPTASLWKGALLAGIGFEVLKQLASLVISSVTQNPLYGAFAIMIALLVWINYFDRLAVLGAAWAVSAVATKERSEVSGQDGLGATAGRRPTARPGAGRRGARSGQVVSAVVGALAGAAAMGWWSRKSRADD